MEPSEGKDNQPPAEMPQQTVAEMMELGEEDNGFYEEEMEDIRKSPLYSLLLVNYEYFDHKLLSMAQQEYRFLRCVEKELVKTQKKADIKISFNLNQFKKKRYNRPIYAVIFTILENARNTKHAEVAAEEYEKLRALEQKLGQPTPKEIELDPRQLDGIFVQVTQRYRCPSSRSGRQAAEFKMVHLEEYQKLKETIESQRSQISELSSRLSGITNQQIADGEIFTDIGDRNTPRMLGRRFNDAFEDVWSSAYEVLKPKKPSAKEDEKEEYDEKTIDLLVDVIKFINKFCQDTAESQVDKLMQAMTPPIVDPMKAGAKNAAPSDETLRITLKMAKDFRKAMAPATVPVLQQVVETKLKGDLLPTEIGKELKEYVYTLVNIIWYMCIQQPAMLLVWGERGKKFDKELFRYSGKKGQKLRLTVWPAVVYCEGGEVAAWGYAIPE